MSYMEGREDLRSSRSALSIIHTKLEKHFCEERQAAKAADQPRRACLPERSVGRATPYYKEVLWRTS
jgi:hypothetical protein